MWGFIFAGAFIAKFYLQARAETNEKEFANRLIISGIFFIGVVKINYLLPGGLTKIIPHPFFFLERLGVILALLGGEWHYLSSKENYSSLLLDVSRESLLVSWFHLQLIYRGFFFGKSLFNLYNEKLTLIKSAMVTILLIAIMMLIVKLWWTFKFKQPDWSRKITYSVISIALVIFFLN